MVNYDADFALTGNNQSENFPYNGANHKQFFVAFWSFMGFRAQEVDTRDKFNGLGQYLIFWWI